MTEDDQIAEILRTSQPSWMRDGKGLAPNPSAGSYAASESGSGQWEERTQRAQIFRNSGSSPAIIDTDAVRVTRNPNEQEPYKFPEGCPPPCIQPPNCGSHDDPNRTLTLSGITFAGAPDPNGVYVLPQNTSGPGVCNWELDTDPNFVFVVTFDVTNTPPWAIAVQAKSMGNPWDGQGVFQASGVTFGSSAASSLPAPPVAPQFFGGGNGTIT